MLWVVETYIDARMKPHMSLGIAQSFMTHKEAADYVLTMLDKGFFCQVFPVSQPKGYNYVKA